MDNDKFKICVKGEAMSLAPYLMNLGDNRSKPVALLEFNLHKILSTLFSRTSLKQKRVTCRNLENVRFHIYHYLVEVGLQALRLY